MGSVIASEAAKATDPSVRFHRAETADPPRARNHRSRRVGVGARWRPDRPFDESDLGRLDAPTLVVVGSNDNIGDPATWRASAGSMPAGQFELVDGAGHMPWFDAPDTVAGHVRRFLGLGTEP
jgi:pimeloyl-ACP methyl ester carboxylesterase